MFIILKQLLNILEGVEYVRLYVPNYIARIRTINMYVIIEGITDVPIV